MCCCLKINRKKKGVNNACSLLEGERCRVEGDRGRVIQFPSQQQQQQQDEDEDEEQEGRAEKKEKKTKKETRKNDDDNESCWKKKERENWERFCFLKI